MNFFLASQNLHPGSSAHQGQQQQPHPQAMAFALPKTLSEDDKREIFEKNLRKSSFFQEALN